MGLGGLFTSKRAPAIDIRPLRPDDAPAVAALHAAGFRHGWNASEIATMIVDPTVIAEGARLPPSGPLVGFVLSRVAADEAEILSIAVAEKARGAGVGARLLGEHRKSLMRRGVVRLFLEVADGNAAAIRLYRRDGFEEVARRPAYYREGETRRDAILMRRDLPTI